MFPYFSTVQRDVIILFRTVRKGFVFLQCEVLPKLAAQVFKLFLSFLKKFFKEF